MKLTGKRVYKNNKEIGLVAFAYSELSKKQKGSNSRNRQRISFVSYISS